MLCPIIVVKVGTNTILNASGDLDKSVMFSIASQIYELRDHGHKVVLVTSGAIACGKRYVIDIPSWKNNVSSQVLACLGQPDLFNEWKNILSKFGIACGQLLYDNHDFDENSQDYIATKSCLCEMLELGFLPIINENDAVTRTEIEALRSFGDNCNLAVQVAIMIGANINIMLTSVDGYLDQNGKVLPEIKNVDPYYNQALLYSKSTDGTGGIVAHLQAARIAQQNNTITVIANGRRENIILDVVNSLQNPRCQRQHPFTVIYPLNSSRS